MLFDGGANAEILNDNHSIETFHSQQITLHLLNPQQTRLQIERHIRSLNDPGTNSKTSLKSAAAEKIFTILQAHYKKTNSDPAYLAEDFKKIANYYSEFPQVIALIDPLKDKNWVLSYDEDNWDTVASGNEFQVEKAVIHFNTRSAAQLLLNRKCSDNPVCIASPADALLHELLHTYSMLVDSTQFVSQGGMNNVLYPYQHEYAIIDAERKLYASMSRVDEVKRPQRTDHTGRAVIAHCPVCIK